MAVIDLDSVIDKTMGDKNTAHITWDRGNYLNATFCVTEECNLKCSYCYMVGKNHFHKMSFEMGKKIVDFLINDPYCTSLTENLMVDFIGGEPLIEIDLIDQISDYIVLSLYVKHHKWFDNFQISFSTNGTLYDSPKVHEYIKKHHSHCGFGFSIDGTKEKHDLTRKTLDGQGSYDMVIKSFGKFQEDFGEEIYQKSTFSSDDLKYLKESIIHLWDLGFKNVESNLVYEDVWKPGDPELFEKQLIDLADYMFESGRYLTHSVAYFEKRRGLPVSTTSLNQNRCGAGYKSLAFDYEGNIYPCIRFLDMCSEDKKSKTVGHISTGINYNTLRALCGTAWNVVSESKCLNCEVGTDCGWCVAQNYQENGSLYDRVTAICEMHKANARANKYFWTRYERLTGRTSDRVIEKVLNSKHEYLKYIYFIMDDDAPSFCNYTKRFCLGKEMSKDLYEKGLEFCLENEVLPIFLGNMKFEIDSSKKIFFEIDKNRVFANTNRSITILDEFSRYITTPVVNYILKSDTVQRLSESIKKFRNIGVRRVNVFISDIELWNEDTLKEYEQELCKLINYIADLYSTSDTNFQINILTDRLQLSGGETRDCAAGINSICLAPNGKFYVCAGFYFTNPDWSIGSIDKGINEDERKWYFRKKSPMCNSCKATACNRCLLNSKISTNEINVPSSMQCRIETIHANAQKKLADKLKELHAYRFIAEEIPQIDYVDYVANMIYKDEKAIAKKWMY